MVDICQEGWSLRSAPQRRHGTPKTVLSQCTWETEQPGLGRWLRCTDRLRQCARKAAGRLSCSNLGKAQNAHPTKSVPLWSTREPEPEWLRPGKCMKCWVCSGQHPCRANWSLSNVHRESTRSMSWGKPSMVHTLQALPTHASEICLQCSSLPTTQLNKWA